MKYHHILYALPTQILFHHLKKNLALLFIWFFFLASVLGGVGQVYGIHYLFLDPEYLNEVSFYSFFWVGLALGNFTIAFHITSYILDGHRFPFIGILEKPFSKYSVNNSLIPLLALTIYVVAIISFQANNEMTDWSQIFWFITGLLLGYSLMHLIMYMYFRFTNKDIFRYLAGSVDKRLRKSQLSRHRVMNKLKETKVGARVDYYFDLRLRFRKCDNLRDFYDKESVLKVFDQNHFNSVILEIIIILLVIGLGFFLEQPWAQIPAAASVLLLFSIVIMLVGAISYWFRGWGVAFVFALFVAANFVAKHGWIGKVHPARGLDYSNKAAPYNLSQLGDLASSENYEKDRRKMLETLKAWRHKFDSTQNPKLVLIAVSGGGQRAALWTVNALFEIDGQLSRPVFENTAMITGASGGMIGAAYYREMYLRSKLKGESLSSQREQMLNNIGKDNLNSIIFSLVVNDTFFKLRTYDYEGHKYLKDRGYIFERSLNANLGGVLDKEIADYQPYESAARIPVMLMSPVVANDGRKLYISSSPVSYFTTSKWSTFSKQQQKIRGVDFSRMFAEQGAENLSFLSALRMSASFPYITPTISLPSNPRVEVMDAGIADNFGISDALKFSYVFEDWLERNTSGLVLLVIRDTRKVSPVEQRSYPSLIDRLTNPISSVYNNLANIQDIRNDAQIETAKGHFEIPVHVVELEYDTYNLLEDMHFASNVQERERKEIQRASLSWHLTTREKKSIIENIYTSQNQKSIEALKKLLQ